MMRALTWLALIGALVIYAGLVAVFGFSGIIAYSIHFVRITITVASLILYIQMAPMIFQEVPPPRRDYLLAGINFMLLSAVCFSFWNEAGRIFGVDTSVFSSPIAGLFSLFLIVGGAFVGAAPDPGKGVLRIVALVVGIILSVGLVFIAPLFR